MKSFRTALDKNKYIKIYVNVLFKGRNVLSHNFSFQRLNVKILLPKHNTTLAFTCHHLIVKPFSHKLEYFLATSVFYEMLYSQRSGHFKRIPSHFTNSNTLALLFNRHL